MSKHLIKGVLSAVVAELLDNYRRLSVQRLRIEVAKSYVHGVSMVRTSTIGLLLAGFAVGLICVGVILFHAALFVLLPWSAGVKAVIGLVLGFIYAAIGAAALFAAMDEGVWMRKSGAARMVDDAIRPSGPGGERA